MEHDMRCKTKNKKGFKYLIRDDIEQIIKEQHIERNRFHEFSKNKYMDLIRKFYFIFSDIKNSSTQFKEKFNINRNNFRSDLKSKCIDTFFRTNDWQEYIHTIMKAIPKNEKIFLILGEGWVYEGKVEETIIVLNEITHITDFYILPSKFEWCIAVSDMEDNAIIYKI